MKFAEQTHKVYTTNASFGWSADWPIEVKTSAVKCNVHPQRDFLSIYTKAEVPKAIKTMDGDADLNGATPDRLKGESAKDFFQRVINVIDNSIAKAAA